MGEVKRMHYVPRVYLKHFANLRGDDSYFISALNKVTGQIFETNIINVCVEKDIYTLPGDTPEARQLIESMYNNLYEVGYDDLYHILIDENKTQLSPAERYSIISFVVSMFYRNAGWNNRYNQFMDDIFERGYNYSKENGKESFFVNDEEIFITGKTLRQLQEANRNLDRPIIALTKARKMFELIRLRMMNDVVTIVKTNGEFQFLTSDNPVTIRSEDGSRPMSIDPMNTLCLPIDKYHLLQLRPWGDQLDKYMLGRVNVDIVGQATVSINNQFQNAQSDRFVLGTLNDLEKFKEKPNGILHGKN
jgi:hypothetical protein